MTITFKDEAEVMADILTKKNKAYDNNYDKTVDKWGLKTIGIRLDDKTARIDNMLINKTYSENGEGLLDNLFDNAGYSFLAIRYLVNNKIIDKSDIEKYFEKNADVNDGGVSNAWI